MLGLKLLRAAHLDLDGGGGSGRKQTYTVAILKEKLRKQGKAIIRKAFVTIIRWRLSSVIIKLLKPGANLLSFCECLRLTLTWAPSDWLYTIIRSVEQQNGLDTRQTNQHFPEISTRRTKSALARLNQYFLDWISNRRTESALDGLNQQSPDWIQHFLDWISTFWTKSALLANQISWPIHPMHREDNGCRTFSFQISSLIY